MSDTEYFEVIYNTEYGGFEFSDKIIQEYCKIKNINDKISNDDSLREDLVMIELIKKHGSKFASTKYSHLVIKKIPIIFRNYYEINEYDGAENITINYNSYKLDQIRNILDLSETKDLEIKHKILSILNKEFI